MARKRPPKSQSQFDAVMRDAEGIVELTNMQLRLAIELRRKLQELAETKPRKKPPKRRS